jgi:acyl-CoA thioesterase FadM
MIADLTNEQGLSMIIRTHICYFEAVNQANAVTVDLWITSRLMAGIVIWSHISL